jgi:hypothetical protein
VQGANPLTAASPALAPSWQRSKAISLPSGDQSGWSSTKSSGGLVTCRAPLWSAATTKIAP